MTHNLFLGMYTFSIKKIHTSNKKKTEINDYLSIAYPDTSGSKFGNGFVQDVISFIDQKAYKNERNTHGGIMSEKDFNISDRTLDLLIDGGISGLPPCLHSFSFFVRKPVTSSTAFRACKHHSLSQSVRIPSLAVH